MQNQVATKVEDGIYFVHPDGCCWIAAEFRNNRCVGTTQESDLGTHNAAGDDWADVEPSETDVVIEGDMAVAIVHRVIGEGVDLGCVTVSFPAK